ncbi:MAG: 50S ribosomal protein L31 [Clostridia bacterium]
MKTGIHPEYREVTIRCACGAEFTEMSTRENLNVEICSRCHPFYTGRRQRTSAGGRIERFRRKYGLASDEGEAERESE